MSIRVDHSRLSSLVDPS